MKPSSHSKKAQRTKGLRPGPSLPSVLNTSKTKQRSLRRNCWQSRRKKAHASHVKKACRGGVVNYIRLCYSVMIDKTAIA